MDLGTQRVQVVGLKDGAVVARKQALSIERGAKFDQGGYTCNCNFVVVLKQ
jgi:hypothetical protein